MKNMDYLPADVPYGTGDDKESSSELFGIKFYVF